MIKTEESTAALESIRRVAQRLADYNVEAAPETEAIYYFPHPDEIRLIETDPTTLPSDPMVPYYFGASPKSGVPYRSAIVLIRPEEAERIATPPGWGDWKEAIKIWPHE
ncbi:MAG: hypothetical protein ACRYFS_11385 [Janthinobacterium lividum]